MPKLPGKSSKKPLPYGAKPAGAKPSFAKPVKRAAGPPPAQFAKFAKPAPAIEIENEYVDAPPKKVKKPRVEATAPVEIAPVATVAAEADAPKAALKPKPKSPKAEVTAPIADDTAAAAPVETADAPKEKEPAASVAPPVPVEPTGPVFDDLGLEPGLLKAVKDAGFESPTPIQARAIPPLLAGRDLIGQAQTGTGKTAAFALPLLQKIDVSRRETQAIVLVPTRELAVQAAEQVYLFSKHLPGLRVVPVYGGQPIDRQFRALKDGAHVVVGTPGRVLDHLRRNSLNLSKATFCALDEADEMLAFGFIEDIETILAELPEGRQMALFSATVPPRIAALVNKFAPKAEKITISSKKRTVESVVQTYYEVMPGKKRDALVRVLDMETPGPTIVFCRTKVSTAELAETLRMQGYQADALNGDMAQNERDRVMNRFKSGQSDLLIATDVAARGLDIETVTHVINYDLPFDTEQYIHRIGRTGRAGRTGDAITLIEPRERRNLRSIEMVTGAKISPVRIPTVADIAARKRRAFVDGLRGRLAKDGYDAQMQTVQELSSDYDPAEIAAAALQALWEATNGVNTKFEAEAEAVLESGQPEAGMTRLFVSMGRQDGLRPGDLVGAIAAEAGLPGKAVGVIELLARTAFVEVPAGEADRVIAALSNTKLRGKRVNVGRADRRD